MPADFADEVHFAEPERMARVLAVLPGAEPPPNTDEFLAVLQAALRKCPDPDRALLNFAAFCEARRGLLSLFTDLIEHPELREDLLRALSHSQVFANVLIASPEWLDVVRMVRAPKPSRADLIATALSASAAMPTALSRRNALRRFRKRELLRIGVADLLGRLSFEEVVASIAELAEACLEACLQLVGAELETEYGTPVDPSGAAIPFAIIGLGKLGGRELNYASDVDVMFVCGSQGETTGPRRVPALDYFHRLAQGILAAMSEPLEEGFIFRADARLRPEGKRGPLVRTLEACRLYYESYGRAWERQALIKARPCAGDLELGLAFVEKIRPFVYGRRLDDADLREIRRLKEQTEARAARGIDEGADLKNGPGGIRDVEFAVQLLQLICGAEHPSVQTPTTLAALDALGRIGALSHSETHALREAYLLERRVEHALQIREERQTHSLPTDPAELDILARRVGYRDGPELTGTLERHMRRVRSIFVEVSAGIGWTGEARRSALEKHVLGVLEDPSTAIADLEELGFGRPEHALNQLSEMAQPARSLDEDPRDSLAEVVDTLCALAAASGDPEEALRNIARLAVVSGGRRRFYKLFRDEPCVAELLTLLAGRSRYLTTLLAAHPELVDALLDQPSLEQERSVEECEAMARTSVGKGAGLAGTGQAMRRFRRREVLRIGARDASGLAGLVQTARELTHLAEAVLALGVEAALDEHGLPHESLALVGLGSLGGSELGYRSDADVIFACWTEDPEEAQALERACAALIREYSRPAPEGPLMRVDARLRPEGQGGPLVPTMRALEAYLDGRAQPWERIAATRARPIVGANTASRRLAEIYERFAYRAPLSAPERSSLSNVRSRVMTERQRSDEDRLDLKLCPGGLLDLDLAVRILQIGVGSKSRAARSTSLPQAIRRLARAQAVPPHLSERLSASWRLMRGLISRIELHGDEAEGLLDTAPESLASLGRKLPREVSERSMSEAELRDAIEDARRLVEHTCLRALEDGSLASSSAG